MAQSARSRSALEVIESDVDAPELTTRCSRPTCREEFPIKVTPGRRQQYCSVTCRSKAEKEYKQALSAVSHYERLLEDARNDAAAFGRAGDGNDRPRTSEEDELAARRAHAAWSSAQTAIGFAQPGDERLHEILHNLVRSLEYQYKL